MREQVLDIVSTDQYPGINWSTGFTNPVDHDPDHTHGISQAHIGSRLFRLNSQHELVITETDFNRKHSKIQVGQPGNTSFSFFSDESAPFDLSDSTRINQAADAARDVFVTLHQMNAADKVETAANQLMMALKMTAGFGTEEHIEEIGILEQLVDNYKRKISRERIQEVARRLQELQVPLLFEGYSSSNTHGFTWTTRELIQFFETGHCPPLPVEDFLF